MLPATMEARRSARPRPNGRTASRESEKLRIDPHHHKVGVRWTILDTVSTNGYRLLDTLSGHAETTLGFNALSPRPVSLERRRELALAAFEVVRARGTHDVTMSDLAASLGMKRPTLYWYFRDLGHVFDVVLEHVLERQRDFIGERLARVDHPIDRLLAYADSVEAFFDREGPMLLSLLSFWGASQGDQPNRVIEIAMRSFLPLRAFAIEALDDAVRARRAAPCNAAGIVDLVSVVIDGFLLHRVARGLTWPEVRGSLWDRVLGPLRIPPRDPPPYEGANA